MRVFIINAKRLMIGAAVFLVVLIAGVVLLLNNSQDVSRSADPASVPASAEPVPSDFTNLDMPTLSLDVSVDGSKADVKLVTNNFQFVKDGMNEVAPAEHGKGHAHLYLDGKMIGIVYDQEFVLSKLPKGEHVLRVELAYSNHTPYKVQAEQKLNVKE